MSTSLYVKRRISWRSAESLVFRMAKFGDHIGYPELRTMSFEQVKSWFKENGIDWTALITDVRYPETPVPYVENLLGAHSVFQGTGSASVSYVNAQGETEVTYTGEGTLASDYAAKLEAACEARDRAIESRSVEELYTALTKMLSAIESFLWQAARDYEGKYGSSPEIDLASRQITLKEKVREWVPIISGGQELDLSKRDWSLVTHAIAMRNDEGVHPKHRIQGITHKELVSRLNEFRDGPASVLFRLHLVLGRPCPSKLIRAVHYPDVV